MREQQDSLLCDPCESEFEGLPNWPDVNRSSVIDWAASKAWRYAQAAVRKARREGPDMARKPRNYWTDTEWQFFTKAGLVPGARLTLRESLTPDDQLFSVFMGTKNATQAVAWACGLPCATVVHMVDVKRYINYYIVIPKELDIIELLNGRLQEAFPGLDIKVEKT
jgi:hypothetical protein